jgi:hypothetical protein
MQRTIPYDAGPPRALSAGRYRVLVLDEERRLDPRLRSLLVHALPALAAQLASHGGPIDAAPDRGE